MTLAELKTASSCIMTPHSAEPLGNIGLCLFSFWFGRVDMSTEARGGGGAVVFPSLTAKQTNLKINLKVYYLTNKLKIYLKIYNIAKKT